MCQTGRVSLRAAHGSYAAGGAVVTVETLPADELPEPIQAAVQADSGRAPRRANGTFVPGNPLARKGGMAKARRVRLVDALGLRRIADDASFRPYQLAAEEFTSHHRSELARQAGGQLGAAPSSMVASAALQLAASRWCFDKGAELSDVSWMTTGSKFADASRQNLLAAYELAVREAKARAEGPGAGAPWLESTSEADGKP
jgi:hypothetical protein